MSSKKHHIYALRMGDGKVFYVGRTIEPRRRLWRHRGGQDGMDAVAVIIQQDPKVLRMDILEVVTYKPRAAEQRWIKHFRNEGFDLVNKQLPASGMKEFKYTREIVESTRLRVSLFEKQKDIAHELGVRREEISLIVNGKKFPDWPGPILGKDYI